MSSRTQYRGNARFFELGSVGAPFRSLVNIDHLTNVRFEQKIETLEAQFDDDGKMTMPPMQQAQGWLITLVLGHGAGGQNILFPDEEQAVACYNDILLHIERAAVPMVRLPRLEPQPKPPPAPVIEGLDGAPIAANGEDEALRLLRTGEDGVPPLTDEELDQLEHPEIDVDGIADAVEEGLGTEPDDDTPTA